MKIHPVLAMAFGIVVVPTLLVALLAGGVSGQAIRAGASAPDIAGGPWIGSDPLTIAALRGRVVLVEFWTHG